MQKPNFENPVHILVIDDDDGIRGVLRAQLETAGYQVTEAPDGPAGLQSLLEDEPDLVLLDLMMPGMDGHAVCRKIREQRRFQDLPIIFLTANTDNQSRIISLDYGANDFLDKPYDRQELLLRIRNLIGWGQSQRDRNPLSGLPGNTAIEAEIQDRMQKGTHFAFLYLDLDHFKAYNDYYSYRAGDDVIKLMSEILLDVVDQRGERADFVGHIGGDDFVVITAPERAAKICSETIKIFDERILGFYRTKEREQGYVEVENRRYELERIPLVSLTIALVESDRYEISHVAELNDLVAELKHRGKQFSGSVVVRDQREPRPWLGRTGSDG